MEKTTLDKTTPGGKPAVLPVNPSPSGAGPMDSGGGQTLLGGGKKEEEETSVSLEDNTRDEEGGAVFKRSNLLSRTPTKDHTRVPPRPQRTLSLDRTRSAMGRKKRKAEQSPPTGQGQREKETLWLRLVSKIAELRSLITANPTTKLEIKRNSEDLQSLVMVLSNLEDTSDTEETEEVAKTESKKAITLCTIGTQTEEQNLASAATQTDRRKEDQLPPTAEQIRQSIVAGMDFAHVEQLVEADWPKSAFRNTTLRKIGILGRDAGKTRLILANEGKFNGSYLNKSLCTQVPGLIGKSISPKGLLMVESKDLVRTESEEMKEDEESRLLMIAGVSSSGRGNKLYDEEDLFSNLRKVRELVEQRSETSLSLALPDDADITRTRKMIECCFADSQVKVNFCLGKKNRHLKADGSHKASKSAPDRSNDAQHTARNNGNWEDIKNRGQIKKSVRKGSVIIVSKEGRTYSEVLKAVKEGVSVAQFPDGAKVTSMQRTKNEDLLIKIKGNGRAAQTLCNVVKEKLPEFKANVKREKKAVLHVSDLDAGTTGDEIIVAIKSELGNTAKYAEEVEITSLRPAYAGTQKATVKMSQDGAYKLLRKKRLLVGWTSCRVKLREDVQRCFRCWETGHLASSCSGPDKSGLCFKCGKAGHLKKLCSEQYTREEIPEENITNV